MIKEDGAKDDDIMIFPQQDIYMLSGFLFIFINASSKLPTFFFSHAGITKTSLYVGIIKYLKFII